MNGNARLELADAAGFGNRGRSTETRFCGRAVDIFGPQRIMLSWIRSPTETLRSKSA